MGHPDPQGYYRILNVHPKASAAAVKKAYRLRSKALHPDTNRRLGAAEQFAALNEAYRVLSDPRARARYDTGELAHPAPGAPPGEGPVPCGRCGKVSAQPRYIIFHQVISRLTHVDHDRIQGIYCPRCARDVGIAASLMTWAVGWWGLPNGPVASIRAIWRNMRGGEVPADANARLLAHQARAFLARGQAPLARALAARAAQVDPDGPDADAAREMAASGEGPVPVLRDPWRGFIRAAPVHLAPAVALVLLVVVAMPGVFARPGAAPAPVLVGGWHVTVPAATLRDGPGRRFSALASLGRFETLAVRAVPTEDGWVPVRAGDLDGFLPATAVSPGDGAEALLAWCRAGAGERPDTGTALTRSPGGPHALWVVNRTGADAAVKLRSARGGTVAAVYVRAGGRARVEGLPEGPLQPVYAVGAAWSDACGTFLEGLLVLTVREPATLPPHVTGGEVRPAEFTLTLAGPAGGDLPVDPEVFRAD